MRAPSSSRWVPFGDLDQYLLPFLQQVADQRNGSIFAAPEPASTTSTTTTAPLAVARTTLAIAVLTGTRALRALGIACGCRRSANLHTGIDGTVAARFRVEHCFRFSLSLFEFQFLAVFLAFRRSRFRGMRAVGQRCLMNFRDGLTGIAIQMSGAYHSLGLLFELFVETFVGRGLVLNRARFFIVDGLFFHRARRSKHWSLVFATRMFRGIKLARYG